MSKQFNVGDTVKYTSPYKHGLTSEGVVKTIHTFNNQKSYNVTWEGHNEENDWVSGDNLSLVSTDGSVSISEAKELKAELESKILRLIQEFNKKTNLEVNDIDFNCYRAIGGGYYNQVAVKVEI